MVNRWRNIPARGTKRRATPRWALAPALWIACLVFFAPAASAQSFGLDEEPDASAADDSSSNDPDELVRQAELLLAKKQPIDARAKLQKALKLRPDDYRIHLMLGQYYLSEVGHFTLAYRYIRTAEDLFQKKYTLKNGRIDPDKLRDQVMILYLRSEAELNLDKYQDSLNTLDHLAEVFPPSELTWYMATRAWVLMKLKRVDEAIQIAQQGLLVDEDSKRIYNILGILLSVKGNASRELSLKAFARAVAGEMIYGTMGQAATPLNNAGEVYRELFRDSLAEASWLRALQMPDGCEHILPSLNMSILYIDQTRFLQADRALKDFEVCYAQHSAKQDTEHRALLALSRGRIALHSGDFERALEQLRDANEREQWFGKIGTNENDVRLAATIGMANALSAEVGALRDTVRDHWTDHLKDLAEIPQLEVRSWWLHRQARRMAIEELEDFEDLSLRNSDTMLEYPTLGATLAGFPTVSLKRRIDRLIHDDDRTPAHDHYRLYLAENLLNHGRAAQAIPILQELVKKLRPIDRLAKAVTLTLLIRANEESRSFWHTETPEERRESLDLREQLFAIVPSRIRSFDLSLPVISQQLTKDGSPSSRLQRARKLLAVRLPEAHPDVRDAAKYELKLHESAGESGGSMLTIELASRADGMILASESGTIDRDGNGYEALINRFQSSAFHHRRDPQAEPVPRLELFDDILLENK